VWLSNNWSQFAPPVGGTGIAEIIGAATPVCTPLQPLPQRPSMAGMACPKQTAAGLPDPSDASDSGPSVWLWMAIGAGVLAARRGFT